MISASAKCQMRAFAITGTVTFFFSSRIRHTRLQGDWSSDVCSSDLFLSPERTLSRKIQESMLSIQIERRFTKPQIFAMYCNQIYLGHGMYGFEAGAQYYFGKHAKIGRASCRERMLLLIFSMTLKYYL